MFDTVCTLPLQSDLFAQAVHPSESLVSVGLSSGHVAAFRLPPIDDHNNSSPQAGRPSLNRRGSNGTSIIDAAWRTRRHKGSCRCLAYSVDGQQIYSAGTDGVVKAADTETGRVLGKVAIPLDPSTVTREIVDGPTVLHALSPQTVLLATDSGALHLYDLRDPAPSLPISNSKQMFVHPKPSQTYHPHTDYISSICAIPPSAASTSGYSKQWLTTGSTTLALTDLRRGVLAKSEDQEELLLSCLYVTGLPVRKSSSSTGEKAIVGGGDGVITLWEKGQWDDQDERIIVSREKETLDCMVHVPDGVGGVGKSVAVGQGDGKVRFVLLGMNKVVTEVQHDDFEGVVAIDFDVEGRMVSGGGQTIKVWQESIVVGEGDDDERDMATKRAAEDDEDEVDSDQEERDGADSSEEEEKPRQRKKKKRKKGKNQAIPNPFNFVGLD